MQFHDYLTIRNKWLRCGETHVFGKHAKNMKSDEFRTFVRKSCWEQIQVPRRSAHDDEWFRWQAQAADMEQEWVQLERPYYNIWPIAITLVPTVRLEVPIKQVMFPFTAMLLRFPHGHEPYSIGTAMLLWDTVDRFFSVHCHFANSLEGLHISFGQYDPEETFECKLERTLEKKVDLNDWGDAREATCDSNEALALMVRLAVFVALLSRDEDLITPVILSKDQTKYDETSDAEVRKWLEERAVRVAGKGFDICKKMQMEKEVTPHWRNPHLCLFWTGEGRTKPIIKMRSGAIIQRVSMADVPTGYLGPEKEEELDALDEKTRREGISKSRRFDIMKRDGFRCQLCGATREQGAKLHVDHKVARAKGGSNEDDNLWTLCEPCNLGKSDKDLL